MTVEAVNFIDSLNTSLPRRGDLLMEGDSHIRNIKTAILNTFPYMGWPEGHTGTADPTEEEKKKYAVQISSKDLNTLTTLIHVEEDGQTIDVDQKVTMTKVLRMGGNRIKNARPPTQPDDALTLGSMGKSIADKILPVGSIWINTTKTSPDTLFGGTWNYTTLSGRTLLGVGSLGVDGVNKNFVVGVNGNEGKFSHTLTADQMPSHSHAPSFTVTLQENGAHSHPHADYAERVNNHHIGQGSQQIGGIQRETAVGGDHSHSATVVGTLGSSGSGQSHNIMQPYYGAYIWVRTA